jgi:hypothetical protein
MHSGKHVRFAGNWNMYMYTPLFLSFFFVVQQPFTDLGRFIVEALRSHTGSVSLDEGSARRRDGYVTTHDTHRRQISMPLAGFEPTATANDRLQTARPPGSTSASYTVIYLFSWACEFELDYQLGTAVDEMYHDTAPSYL